jgi:arsenate reductase
MIRVIFACVHNAGRSQMASTWFNRLADPDRAHAISAGTAPADHVHAEVKSVMQEVGIDLSAARPELLTSQMLSSAHYLITMGCGEACPAAPKGLERRDWPIEDPKGMPIASVRRIRDEIRARVLVLISELGVWPLRDGRT